ncbi:MAG: hypothetical protein P8J32_01570 [bacterium]|nr:hypothetical protein [bacterium]
MSHQTINLPQALQNKLAAVEETSPGMHLVKLITTKGFIPTVKIVNRCVAVLSPLDDIATEDMTDLEIIQA